MARYYARSASDKTDDWPFWFVADSQRGGLNVTAKTAAALGISRTPGSVLGEDWIVVKQAMRANRELNLVEPRSQED